MIPKKREPQGMSARLFLRSKDHRDAIYMGESYNEPPKYKKDYCYITGMYYEGSIQVLPDTEIPDIDTDDVLSDIKDDLGSSIDIPEIEVPTIDIPDIDKPIQTPENNDPMETGFVWKRYPELAILTYNGTYKPNTSYRYGFGVLKTDCKCIFTDVTDFAGFEKFATRTDKYGIVVMTSETAPTTQKTTFLITKDGYEFKWYTAPQGTLRRVYPMGETRFATVRTSVRLLEIYYYDILDYDTMNVVEHYMSITFSETEAPRFPDTGDIQVVGASYSGLLITVANGDRDKITLYEARPSGFYKRSTIEMNFKARWNEAYMRDNVMYNSFQRSGIVRCGDYYIFATHRISAFTGRPWGAIYVYKSTDLDNWDLEVLIENYDSPSYIAPCIQMVSRGDIAYIYTYTREYNGYLWKAKGYYSTRGQRWNEIQFDESISIDVYTCEQTNPEPGKATLYFAAKDTTSGLLYKDLVDTNNAGMYWYEPSVEQSRNSGPSVRINDGICNIFFKYGKIDNTVNYVGFVLNLGFLFINPMMSSSPNNFFISKMYGSGYEATNHDTQFIQNGDYCV